MPKVKPRGGELASARAGDIHSQPQEVLLEDKLTAADRINGSALQHIGTCCRSRPLPAYSIERVQRVRELLIKFEREVEKLAVNDGNWYGSGIPIRILRKVPKACRYNPPPKPQPNGSATGDRMNGEGNSGDLSSTSGGGESTSSYDYEAFKGKGKGKSREGLTSSKPQPSLEAKHHSEGGREDVSLGEPELVQQVEAVEDFVRKVNQEGGGNDGAMCRNDADTDVPMIIQPRQDGDGIGDGVGLAGSSIPSRKRSRRSAGRMQDQAESTESAVEGVVRERATCDASDQPEELVESRARSDEPSSPPRKRVTPAQGGRSNKRKTRQPKMIHGQDDEYRDPETRRGDFDPEYRLPAKRRLRSTRAAPPPTTMEKPLEILSDDEVKAEDGGGSNLSGGASGASGILQQQPAATALPHDGGDKMDSGLVATDFGDGILGVRTRKERVGAMPGIRKVLLSWGKAFLNQRSIRPVPHETRLFFPNKEAQGAVEVTRLDVIRLQETVFLNDTLIDFYLRYLLSKPESFGGRLTASQVHVFSPLFVQAITNAANSSRSDAYHRIVKKWTKGLNLFSKKFVFFPINSCLHWSLVILCNPDRFTATRPPQPSNPPPSPSSPSQKQQQNEAPTDVDDTRNAPASPALHQSEVTPTARRVPSGENKPSPFMTQTEEVGEGFVPLAQERVDNSAITPAPCPEAVASAQVGVTGTETSQPCSDEGDGGWPEPQAVARHSHQVEEGGEEVSNGTEEEDGNDTELEPEPLENPGPNHGQILNDQMPCAESALHDDQNEQDGVMDQEEGQPMCTGELVGGGKPGRQSRASSAGGDRSDRVTDSRGYFTGNNPRDESSSTVESSAVEDLAKVDEIEDQNTFEVDSPNPRQDSSNRQHDDSWGLVRGRYRAGAESLDSATRRGSSGRLPLRAREPATASAHTTRAGRRVRPCRQGDQAVGVPLCSLQGLPASHSGPAKRPVRTPVRANSGGAGDSSSAGMVDLTTPDVETVPETVDVSPRSSRPRWSAPQDYLGGSPDHPAVLSAEHSVGASPGQSLVPSTRHSATRSAQRWTVSSPEQSLKRSPALEQDDDGEARDGHDREDHLGYPSDGCAVGEASGSPLTHEVSATAVGSSSNIHNDDNDNNSKGVCAIDKMDTMDISPDISTDKVVTDTVVASVANEDAKEATNASPETRAPEILDTRAVAGGEQHGLQSAKTAEIPSNSQPAIRKRNLRRISRDGVDVEDSRGAKEAEEERAGAGKEAERAEAENEEIPCMFMLDSTRGHRSQEVFKIVRKYVEAAWNDSRRESIGEADVCPRTLPGCSPPVPQQSNDCDCGVYVIHYAKLFLKNPPAVTRGIFTKSGRSVFSKKWFKESAIVQERRDIRNTVEKLRWEAIQEQRTSSG